MKALDGNGVTDTPAQAQVRREAVRGATEIGCVVVRPRWGPTLPDSTQRKNHASETRPKITPRTTVERSFTRIHENANICMQNILEENSDKKAWGSKAPGYLDYRVRV